MIFKKSLINLAMIETVIFMTSVNVGINLPTQDKLAACFVIWVICACLTLIPAMGVSFLFAYLAK